MASIEPPFVSPPNSQKNSVFFTLFPKEIRDQIFDLAITPYEKREAFLPEDLEYHRSNFRDNHRGISTALLRTCQRIYGGTCDIPARNYIKVDCDQVAEQAPGLRHLTLTVGHGQAQTSDTRLLPNPYITQGKPDVSYNTFWGCHLPSLNNLRILEVEAETVIDRMEELDDAVGKAMNWRITVGSNKKLVLNPEKTRREGCHGPVSTKSRCVYASSFDARYPLESAQPPNTIKAEERLLKAGVGLVQLEDSENQASINRLTFYAVTLVFEAEKKAGHEVPGIS
ncbi:hypothetical protein G7Y79_00017g041970 [Physcia stellaris]|nr:hypothetical protein G7Y79_00017g041970 [Physcia stellaris]